MEYPILATDRRRTAGGWGRHSLTSLMSSVALAGSLALVTVLAVVAEPAPAQAQVPSTQVVMSGNARFEVLSPRLIRAEYAQLGAFTDEPTFNVVGRDSYEPTAYSAERKDGWLEISTGQTTLAYKEGTGRFTSQNVKLTVKTGAASVSATPSFDGEIACEVATVC